MATDMADTRTQLNTVRARIAQYEDLGWSVPVQLLEQESHLSLQLRNEQADRLADLCRLNREQGKRHGLLGLGCDYSAEDLEYQDAEEQALTTAYLEGFQAGQDLGDDVPEARVEALEKLLREWEREGDSHPGKHIAIEEIVEVLQMETARLSMRTLAA